MFSKDEKRKFNTDFWTAFGVYMRKHKPTAQPKLQWLNYRTGVPDLYFRMHIDTQSARVSIDLQMHDDIREIYWEQWEELKVVFTDITGKEWLWEELVELPDGRLISRISVTLENVSIYRKEDWQKVFQFLETHIVPVDEFWADFQEIFKALV